MTIFNDDYLIIKEDSAIVNGDHCVVRGDGAIVNGDFCKITGRGAIINGDFCKYVHKPAALHGYSCKRVKSIKASESDKRYTQARSISGFVSNIMCSSSNVVSSKTAGLSGAIIQSSPGSLYINGERVTDYSPGISRMPTSSIMINGDAWVNGRHVMSKGRAIVPTESATPKPAAPKKRASEDKTPKIKRRRADESD
jgi:hypothetical protein